MNKKTYLKELFEYLYEKGVKPSDIDNVINEYAEIYDEALDSGLDDQAVIKKLGTPKEIYTAIKDTVGFKANGNYNKLVAIMPFISTILFFSMGFAFDLWQVAWMSYLLIPITAIIVNTRGGKTLIAISPFVAVITFMLLGFFADIWHPTWMIFLIVPIAAIISETPGKNKIIALSPFVILITYMLIGTYLNLDFLQYGWAMFALVPILAILLHPIKVKEVVMLLTILLAVAAHLMIGFTTKDWTYAWLVYFIPGALAILLGYVDVVFSLPEAVKDKKWPAVIILLILITYLTITLLLPPTWTWGWIILLLIPIVIIYASIKFEHPVAYMPFISTILFIVLGQFFDLYHIAWIVYLLIPMVAILTESNNDEKPKIEEENDLGEE